MNNKFHSKDQQSNKKTNFKVHKVMGHPQYFNQTTDTTHKETEGEAKN